MAEGDTQSIKMSETPTTCHDMVIETLRQCKDRNGLTKKEIRSRIRKSETGTHIHNSLRSSSDCRIFTSIHDVQKTLKRGMKDHIINNTVIRGRKRYTLNIGNSGAKLSGAALIAKKESRVDENKSLVKEIIKDNKDAGEITRNNKDAGGTTRDRKDHGGNTRYRKDSGETIQDKKDPGGTTRDRKDSGETMKDKKDPGGTTRDRKDSGKTTRDKKDPGGTTKDKKGPGGTTRDKKDSGETTRDKKDPGGTTKDKKGPGGTTRDGKDPGGTTRDRRDSGGTARDKKNSVGDTTIDKKQRKGGSDSSVDTSWSPRSRDRDKMESCVTSQSKTGPRKSMGGAEAGSLESGGPRKRPLLDTPPDQNHPRLPKRHKITPPNLGCHDDDQQGGKKPMTSDTLMAKRDRHRELDPGAETDRTRNRRASRASRWDPVEDRCPQTWDPRTSAHPSATMATAPQLEILPFKGARDVLSNFYPCQLIYNGERFGSSEHAYQYTKAYYHGNHDIAYYILQTPNALEAKRLARSVRVSRDWIAGRVDTLKEICSCKWRQVSEVRSLLMRNPESLVAEAVPRDFFWSSGLDKEKTRSTPPDRWPGQNAMGNIWMEIRDAMMGEHDRQDVGQRTHPRQSMGGDGTRYPQTWGHSSAHPTAAAMATAPQPEILPFKGARDVLSNFYPCQLIYNGERFGSSEHAYQYAKAYSHGSHDIAFSILQAPNALEAKRLARSVRVSRDWIAGRVDTLKEICSCKWQQVSEVRSLLMRNPKSLVAEAVPQDFFWSSGLDKEKTRSTSPARWPGQNAMGNIWMEIRDAMMGEHDRQDVGQRPHPRQSMGGDGTPYPQTWGHSSAHPTAATMATAPYRRQSEMR